MGYASLRRRSRPKVETRYSEAAAELGTSEAAVKVAVHRLRTRLGALLRLEIADTASDPEAIDDELRHLIEVLRESGGMA